MSQVLFPKQQLKAKHSKHCIERIQSRRNLFLVATNDTETERKAFAELFRDDFRVKTRDMTHVSRFSF